MNYQKNSSDMYYFPFRYSKNIEKQILWYILAIFLLKKRYKKVLDVGCGFAQNIRFIKFRKYLGIDIDQKRIEKNNMKFKSSKINFEKKDIFEKNNLLDKYDLIILIQVLTNSLFNKTQVDKALTNILEISNGRFIFNTSNKNINEIAKIDCLLKEKKIKFKKIYYGIPNLIKKIKIPLISQVIALIYLLLIFTSSKIMNKGKIIYICEIN